MIIPFSRNYGNFGESDLYKCGAHPHPKGDTCNSKIVKIHHNLKNFRIRTVPISTKASLDEGE